MREKMRNACNMTPDIFATAAPEVEKVTDLDSIEKTGLYKGLYHVLGGAINPLDNILPNNLRIAGVRLEMTKAQVRKLRGDDDEDD